MADAYPDGEGGWDEIAGPFVVGNFGYPYNWAELASESDRAAIGVRTIAEPGPPAPYLVVTGSALVDVDGSPARVWTTEDLTDADLVAAKALAVDAERDRRIAGGLTLNGKQFQTRQSDRENIAIMGVQAQLAIAAGAQPGDLHWHGDPAEPFVWITADNSTVELDAPGMVELFTAGIGFKTSLTFAARAKKDWLQAEARDRAEVIAFDPAADWPA